MTELTEPKPIQLTPKKKYMVAKPQSRHSYRSRTGPKCCNSGCGNKRRHKKHVRNAPMVP